MLETSWCFDTKYKLPNFPKSVSFDLMEKGGRHSHITLPFSYLVGGAEARIGHREKQDIILQFTLNLSYLA